MGRCLASPAQKPGCGVQRFYHGIHDPAGGVRTDVDFLGIGLYRLGSHLIPAQPGKWPLVWNRRSGPGHIGAHAGGWQNLIVGRAGGNHSQPADRCQLWSHGWLFWGPGGSHDDAGSGYYLRPAVHVFCHIADGGIRPAYCADFCGHWCGQLAGYGAYCARPDTEP